STRSTLLGDFAQGCACEGEYGSELLRSNGTRGQLCLRQYYILGTTKGRAVTKRIHKSRNRSSSFAPCQLIAKALCDSKFHRVFAHRRDVSAHVDTVRALYPVDLHVQNAASWFLARSPAECPQR